MYSIIVENQKAARELGGKVAAFLKTASSKRKDKDDKNIQAIIAIGGDNFFLRTFREQGSRNIPVLCIAPSQSFLCQATILTYQTCLRLLIANHFIITRRTRLVCTGASFTSPFAFNDIGLFSSKSAKVLTYTLHLDNEVFRKENADGLIVSTPTGSTGYAFSVGGPLIVNQPPVISITPISSLERHSPLIVSDAAIIRCSDIRGHAPIVIIDGDVRIPVRGRTIEIKKSPFPALMITFSKNYAIESKLKQRSIKTNMSQLKAMPPSAKLIYKILLHEGTMTQKELVAASLLPARTIRYALSLLIEKQLIKESPYLNDTRQTIYGV